MLQRGRQVRNLVRRRPSKMTMTFIIVITPVEHPLFRLDIVFLEVYPWQQFLVLNKGGSLLK